MQKTEYVEQDQHLSKKNGPKGPFFPLKALGPLGRVLAPNYVGYATTCRLISTKSRNLHVNTVFVISCSKRSKSFCYLANRSLC